MTGCHEILKEEKVKNERVSELHKNLNNKIDKNLETLESKRNLIISDINDCAEYFDIDYLLEKYKLIIPLNNENAYNSFLKLGKIRKEDAPELYFLMEVILFFNLESKIKNGRLMKIN